MVLEGKQGQTHIGEDKVLSDKVNQLEKFFGSSARFVAHVDVSVIRLSDTTKEYSHNT
jgi:hypothetical protein